MGVLINKVEKYECTMQVDTQSLRAMGPKQALSFGPLAKDHSVEREPKEPAIAKEAGKPFLQRHWEFAFIPLLLGSVITQSKAPSGSNPAVKLFLALAVLGTVAWVALPHILKTNDSRRQELESALQGLEREIENLAGSAARNSQNGASAASQETAARNAAQAEILRQQAEAIRRELEKLSNSQD
jgi:hypothetical protein